MAEKAMEDPGAPTVPGATNLSRVFAASKIKSALQQNEDIGSISQPALELIGAASAAFLKTFVEAAVQQSRGGGAGGQSSGLLSTADDFTGAAASQETNICGGMLRLQDLKVAAQADERFRFLSDTLDNVSSQLNDNRPAKRPKVKVPSYRKKVVSLNNNEIAHVAHLSQGTESLSMSKEIIVDEEDYD